LSFGNGPDSFGMSAEFDLFIDVYFFIDIILKLFFVAYETQPGEFETRKLQLARLYME